MNNIICKWIENDKYLDEIEYRRIKAMLNANCWIYYVCFYYFSIHSKLDLYINLYRYKI